MFKAKHFCRKDRKQCPRRARRVVLSVYFILTFAFAIVFGANTCNALEKLKVFRGVLLIEGTIEPGDYSSVFNFLRDESNFKKISGGVFLASPGGYVFEAMKIGNLIRDLRLGTDAPSNSPSEKGHFSFPTIAAPDLKNPANYQCISACFLVYVAGIYRHLAGTGRLGLHQPQLSPKASPLSEEKSEAAKTYVRNWIKSYLGTMNVPNKYVDLMYSVPANQLRWITQDEFDADLNGYIAPLRDFIDKKCNPRPNEIKLNLAEQPAITLRDVHATPLSTKQSDEIIKCVVQTKAELPIEAWHKVFELH
jgi:hypothetical protein